MSVLHHLEERWIAIFSTNVDSELLGELKYASAKKV